MAYWIKYRCKSCAHEFDGLHYQEDEPQYTCKACDSADTEVLEIDRPKSSGFWNKEVSFGSPVKSPVDGKHYASRKRWDDHLKAHRCVELGNDPAASKKHEGLRGDFDTKKDVAETLNRMGI